jgi:CheY-like chemotaxis protein
MVEDNPGDVELAREGLKEGELRNNLHVVEDGEKAMAYLLREGAFADRHPPDLILLDLNLPGRDGREVLAVLKEHPDLKHIPVVVLTSSQAEEDIMRSYQLHANCYIAKPITFKDLVKVVEAIEAFWFSIVTLPGADSSDR